MTYVVGGGTDACGSVLALSVLLSPVISGQQYVSLGMRLEKVRKNHELDVICYKSEESQEAIELWS